MATSDRARGTDASPLSSACREASFAHLVVRADGDALAAASILAGAFETVGTPYQVSPVRTRAALEGRLDATDRTATAIVVGASADVDSLDESPVSLAAYETAAELGVSPDPTTALAGVVAAGENPDRAATTLVDEAGLDREPGVAIPTDDAADGLAHSTLVHAGFSGDPDAVPAIQEADPRDVASMVALAVAGAPDASDRAGTAVERALRPYVGGPLETIGGYADVLCALARGAPGLGVALGLGRDVREPALERWRERARTVHDGVDEASTARYDGLLVVRTDGPVEPVARLIRDFRSPEPAVLAIGDGEAALATVDAPASALETAAERADCSALARGDRGYARVDDAEEALVEALREEL